MDRVHEDVTGEGVWPFTGASQEPFTDVHSPIPHHFGAEDGTQTRDPVAYLTAAERHYIGARSLGFDRGRPARRTQNYVAARLFVLEW